MPDYPGDWLPKHGWTGFKTPIRLDDEELLWERYLREYKPAQDGLLSEDYAPVPPWELRGATAQRARVISATLFSERLTVQRVARWRRHFPTDEWERLRRWLPDGEIRQAYDRLRALGLLAPPHWIVH